MNIQSIIAAAAALTMISAPTFAAEDEKEKVVDQRIGAEVDRICFPRNINGWKSVKGEDNVVLLKKSASRWYRVEVSGACPERVFRFAHVIGLDSRPAGGCLRRGDTILVEDTGGFNRRCSINRMYKWDKNAPAPGEEEETEETESDS